MVDREGVIICGHTRLLAAYKLGLREASVHVAENLTPAQVRAYRLLDNRSHDETTWDDDLGVPTLRRRPNAPADRAAADLHGCGNSSRYRNRRSGIGL